MFCSLHLAKSIYGSNHEQRIKNVMDSTMIAPDRSPAAERVDFSNEGQLEGTSTLAKLVSARGRADGIFESES